MQCYFNFCSTVVIQFYVYIYIYIIFFLCVYIYIYNFQIFFSIMVYHRLLNIAERTIFNILPSYPSPQYTLAFFYCLFAPLSSLLLSVFILQVLFLIGALSLDVLTTSVYCKFSVLYLASIFFQSSRTKSLTAERTLLPRCSSKTRLTIFANLAIFPLV